MKTKGCRLLVTLLGVSFYMLLVADSFTQAEERTEIVIGASLELTGSQSAHGRDLKWAYELAASRINATGGVLVKDYGKKLRIRLVFADNGTNAMKAASMVEKLINVDKVDMLLGGAEPTCVIAACMAAEKYRKYYHTAFGFPDFIWLEKKLKWSTNFFFSMDQFDIPFKILSSMSTQDRPRKLGVALEDSFAGEGLAKVLQDMARKHGYEVALTLKLPIGTKDYAPQISKAKDSGVDAMLLFAPVEDSETFVRNLKKDNLNISYLHAWKGAWSGTFWKDLTKDAQYVICDGFWSMDYPFDGAKGLGDEYYKTFGEYSVSVGLSYALGQILFQAIEKAGSLDGAKVREAVLAHSFDTVMGSVKYDSNGLALFPQIAAQWWDGKQMLIYPTQYASWRLRLAPPWNQR